MVRPVLHIVKANQDYDADLGNDFVHGFKRKCVIVFTFCDMLDKKDNRGEYPDVYR